MSTLVIILILWWIAEKVDIIRQRKRVQRIQAEQQRQRAEQTRLRQQQAQLRREQSRQAAQLAKHEERIAELEQRISDAEAELSFNRDQRDRLFKLLKVEENQISDCDEGSEEWKKHQQKIIRIESQIHSVQKRIDKAQFSKYTAEKQLAA